MTWFKHLLYGHLQWSQWWYFGRRAGSWTKTWVWMLTLRGLSWGSFATASSCCCSVAQSCPTLCWGIGEAHKGVFVVVVQSLNCVWCFVTPWTAACQASLSFTISQNLLKLMSIESVMPSHHFILCCLLLLLPSVFPSIRVFSNELTLHIRRPKIGTSTLASVLLMTIQGWSPLGLTGLISLQSKGLSRVFSSTTIQKHQFFGAQPSLCTVTSVHGYWINHGFDYTDLCRQSDVSGF